MVFIIITGLVSLQCVCALARVYICSCVFFFFPPIILVCFVCSLFHCVHSCSLFLSLSLFYVCLFVCMCNHFLLLFEQTDIEKIRTLDGFSFSNNIIDDHTQKKVTIHILKKQKNVIRKKFFFFRFGKNYNDNNE